MEVMKYVYIHTVFCLGVVGMFVLEQQGETHMLRNEAESWDITQTSVGIAEKQAFIGHSEDKAPLKSGLLHFSILCF